MQNIGIVRTANCAIIGKKGKNRPTEQVFNIIPGYYDATLTPKGHIMNEFLSFSHHQKYHSGRKVPTSLLAVLLSCSLAVSPAGLSNAYAQESAQESRAVSFEGTGDGSAENPVFLPADKVVTQEINLDELRETLSSDNEEAAPNENGVATYSSNAASAANGQASAYTANTSANAANPQVVELYGDMQYDTAAAEALYSFDSSEYAIIASGISGVDALSATALAGALNCPILLASDDYLPAATTNALKKLGVTQPILVGGPSAMTEDVESEVAAATGATPLRLWGDGIIDTQLAIFNYGQERNLWTDLCLVAQGVKSYADALSFAPIAYKMKAPVFLTNSDGLLPQKSQDALKSGRFVRALVGGGEAAVAEETIPLVRSLLSGSGAIMKSSVVRLGGRYLYDTSAEIAKYAVEQGILSWDKAAFATGTTMTDSLAGAAVQGRDGSVILLIDPDYYSTLNAITEHKNEVSSIKFFGGPMVVSMQTRNDVTDALELPRSPLNYETVKPNNPDPSTYAYEQIALSLSEFAQMEVGYKVNSDGSQCSADDILEYLDPQKYDNTTSEFMEFVNIGAGYSGISAETIDAFIESRCAAVEDNYNKGSMSDYYGFPITSKLRGMGSVIVEAAKQYNINEAYLLAHAAIESAWGCSPLSQGLLWNREAKEWEDCGYLNFFGIGAFDSDPENGAAVGSYYGWSNPESAIRGGAYWISENYIHSENPSSGNQNTLWKMAWDATAAQKYGNMSHAHQYATGRTWAIGISWVMDSLYTKHMGRYFDFDELGLSAIVPVFQ